MKHNLQKNLKKFNFQICQIKDTEFKNNLLAIIVYVTKWTKTLKI